ncbi:MAG: hypothetical protein IKV82_07065 [Akkermansia sp.]|nr:hypothetical protein [Akkermansia sp.]
MNSEERRALPWWQIPHALGLDVAFAVCMWARACAEGVQASLAGSGGWPLLVGGAWLSVMVPRLMSKTSRCRAWPLVCRILLWVVALGAELWLLWLLLYEMGAGMLAFVSYAVALLCWSLCFRWCWMKSACWSWALAIMCYGPIVNYAMSFYNGAILFQYLSIWGMAGVFFLFFLHRQDTHRGRGRWLTWTCTLILLNVSCCWCVVPAEEKSILGLFVLGVMSIVLLRWLVRGRGVDACDALDWPVMGLAAVAHLCFFAV